MFETLEEKTEKIYTIPQKNEEEIEKLCGVFSNYARHDLSIDEIMELEKEAWQNAAAERYLRSL